MKDKKPETRKLICTTCAGIGYGRGRKTCTDCEGYGYFTVTTPKQIKTLTVAESLAMLKVGKKALFGTT